MQVPLDADVEVLPTCYRSTCSAAHSSGTFEESVVSVSMSSNFSSFSRRGPDNVTEELVAVLSDSKLYEFKALFVVVHAGLRARNAASGGEEMLRLRAYEKLQHLVQQGQVKKTGKQYRGVPKALLALSKDLKALRESGRSFAPKPAVGRRSGSARRTKTEETE
jgi:hypothetical protein